MKKHGDRVKDAVFKEIVATCNDIRTDAYNDAPKAFGSLQKGLATDFNKQKTNGRVESRANYSIYVEKGRPPGGMPPVRRIRSWAAKKSSVPESAAYPIALKIAREGTRPQPFFKPAYEKNTKGFFKRVEKQISKLK